MPDDRRLPSLAMPSLGADMESGKVVQWRVKPGDVVNRGDIVAEVETEKGVFEVDATAAGVVAELLVETGAKARVGAPLLAFAAAGDGQAIPAPGPEVQEPAWPHAPSGVAPTGPPSPAGPPGEPAARVRASPLARRMAAALGVDLTAVHGTGAEGTIVRGDVQRTVASRSTGTPTTIPSEAPERPAVTGRVTEMRRAIAAAVTRSKREIPHYYLGADVDLSHAMTWLRETNLTRGVDDRILPAALFVKAVALALVQFPDLNGFWVDGELRPSSDVHVGIAVSLRDGGLIAPAVLHASRLSLPEVMRTMRDLVQRARAGGVRASEMTAPTVTVTNLGDQGVSTVFGVIYPPQVAIIGFGRIEERAWADAGMLGVRPVVSVSLSGDHRATDGHYGARFISAVRDLLQTPEAL